jgi:hypothetical protein
VIRGLKTSEFWIVAVAAVASFLSHRLHIPVTAAAVADGAAAIYAAGRSFVKAHLPLIAQDVSGIERRLAAVEAAVRASPALSAEQAALLSKLQSLVGGSTS